MKIFLLAAITVLATFGCRSEPYQWPEPSPEARAQWEANRKARELREKEHKQEWRQRNRELAKSAQQNNQNQLEFERFQKLASSGTLIAEIDGSRIYQIEEMIYAQQVVAGEIEMEVIAESWKQENDELVFWGNAIGQTGDISIGTRPENSEIRFLPDGRYRVIAAAGTHRGGTKLMIPLDN